MRYFRSRVAVYEWFRQSLDAAYGYPNRATLTETSIPPATDAPVDQDGLVYVAVSDEYCEFELPAKLLADAIASNAVEEVDEATYSVAACKEDR